MDDPLLTVKEIATEFRRHVTWVWAMKKDDEYLFPGGRAKISSILAHLKSFPHPRRTRNMKPRSVK